MTAAATGEPAESMLDQVQAIVERVGDRLAVVDEHATRTYTELWGSAMQIAGGLRDQGSQDGDRVCVDFPNGVRWVEAFLGTLLAGAVAVPLDPRATEEHRSFVRENAEARLTLGPSAPLVRGCPRGHRPCPEELALILYTSGTTGTPKGVMLSHGNLAAYRRITEACLDTASRDQGFRNLIVIPLCHSAGCNTQLVPTLTLGGTAVIAPGSGPTSVRRMLEAWRPDVMFAVPVVYRRLLDATVEDRSALRCLRDVHFGAAAAPQALIRDLREALPWARLGNAFGMTEISNVALFLPDEDLESAAMSVGFPVPGVECTILEPDARGHGELLLRGPNMALGYWRRPELTEQVFGTGWVRSGDVAERGTNGAIYLHDRKDDVINRGGEKIFSTSVEDALSDLPGVTEAAVVGLPDEELGAIVAAVIVAVEPYDLNRVRTLLHKKLPHHAIPERLVTQSTPLLRGSSGKILKSAVVERLHEAPHD